MERVARGVRWGLFGCAVVGLGLSVFAAGGAGLSLLALAVRPTTGAVALAMLLAALVVLSAPLYGLVALLRRTHLGLWLGASVLIALATGACVELVAGLLANRALPWGMEAGIVLGLGFTVVACAGGRTLLRWQGANHGSGLTRPGFVAGALRRAVLVHFAIAPILLATSSPLSSAHVHGFGNRGCLYYEGHAPLFLAAGSVVAALLLYRGRTIGLLMLAAVDLGFGGWLAWMWIFMSHALLQLVAFAAGSAATALALSAVAWPAWRTLTARHPAPARAGNPPDLVQLHLGNVALLLLLPIFGCLGAGLLGNVYWGSEAGEVEFLHLTLLAAPFAAGLVASRSGTTFSRLELQGKRLRRQLAVTGVTLGGLLSALWFVAAGFTRPIYAGLPSVLVDGLIPLTGAAVALVALAQWRFAARARVRRAVVGTAAVLLLLAIGLVRAPHFVALYSGPPALLTGSVYEQLEDAQDFRVRWATHAPVGLPSLLICSRNSANPLPECAVLAEEMRALRVNHGTPVAELRQRLAEGHHSEPFASLAAEEVARRLWDEGETRAAFATMERLIVAGPPERARRRHAWLMGEYRLSGSRFPALRPRQIAHARRVVELTVERDRWSAEASRLLSFEAEGRGDYWAAFWHQTRARSHLTLILFEERPADRLLRLLWTALWRH